MGNTHAILITAYSQSRRYGNNCVISGSTSGLIRPLIGLANFIPARPSLGVIINDPPDRYTVEVNDTIINISNDGRIITVLGRGNTIRVNGTGVTLRIEGNGNRVEGRGNNLTIFTDCKIATDGLEGAQTLKLTNDDGNVVENAPEVLELEPVPPETGEATVLQRYAFRIVNEDDEGSNDHYDDNNRRVTGSRKRLADDVPNTSQNKKTKKGT